MRITKSGSTLWSKKDRENYVIWRAKKLGLKIETSKDTISIKKRSALLVSFGKKPDWTEDVDLFLMGCEHGLNRKLPEDEQICTTFNNYPPYKKVKKTWKRR